MSPASEVIKVGELEIRFQLDPAHTGGTISVFESVVPPGARVPVPHRHVTYDEAIHVLAGTCTFTVNGRETVASAGTTLFVARGTPHGFANRGQDTVRLLAITTPGLLGPDYFREVASIVNAGGPPDRARIGALMARHGMEPVLAG